MVWGIAPMMTSDLVHAPSRQPCATSWTGYCFAETTDRCSTPPCSAVFRTPHPHTPVRGHRVDRRVDEGARCSSAPGMALVSAGTPSFYSGAPLRGTDSRTRARSRRAYRAHGDNKKNGKTNTASGRDAGRDERDRGSHAPGPRDVRGGAHLRSGHRQARGELDAASGPRPGRPDRHAAESSRRALAVRA